MVKRLITVTALAVSSAILAAGITSAAAAVPASIPAADPVSPVTPDEPQDRTGFSVPDALQLVIDTVNSF
ncbi:hypothetical protein J7W19_01565 [Streptomyces mobaraensis NBRC 13819 = DSM 40847]|uniref:hypothetical protein n=1 Tax=Streptomyces mobaraensis TaxID=35621 RepID=UPI00131A112D|nr:hypothetical protein [Streptomyces mobaraensis]QTT72289.1 hypothetical protein J7W19_01565 [Streptomyces mobaraensis NBRC 13819 = DSM 40847]